MHRYRYNEQLSPPAPFVFLTLSNPLEPLSIDRVPAQLDTGADRTLIPQELVDLLQLDDARQIPIGGLGGEVMLLKTYLVKIAIHDFEPVVIEVVADRREPLILLGRDILNNVKLVLDGPNRVLEIGKSS